MTIELTDLPLIPAGQLAAAFTMAAVPSANGPIRYKASLANSLGGTPGPAGSGFSFRGAWAASTAYAADDVLTNGGQTYVALTGFTSGSAFDASNLALWAAKGADGAPGGAGIAGPAGTPGSGFTFRGAWAASTAYALRDVVTNGGQTYVATTAFTSGASFDATNLSLIAAKGADGAPAAPYVAPYRPELTLPTDGSNFGAQINAFTADCKNHGYSCGYLHPGFVTAEVSVAVASEFDLIGMGKYDQGGFATYDGGVKIRSPLNSTTPAVSMIGTSSGGASTTGMIIRPGLINLCVMGALQNTVAIARDNPALIDCQHVYKLRMENIYAGNDFIRSLRLMDVWDSNIDDFWSNSGGFSDPTASPSDAAVLTYTGRSAALPVELAIGRSLGVPSVEIVSPATTGADVCNNIRIRNLFIESNPHNGVPLMIHGPNTSAIQIFGAKIEAVEGCVPMIVLDNVHGFFCRGFFFGAASGSPYAQVGAVAAGTPWNTYTTPGALVLASDCISPVIEGSGGYNGAGSGRPDALLRFENCEDPKVSFSVEDGVTRLSTARMIFNNCKHVSTVHNRAYAQSYILGLSGANQTESVYTGSTTQDA